MRLGDDQLKRSIELFVACGDNVPLKFVERRNLGLVRSMRGPAQCTRVHGGVGKGEISVIN